MTKKTKTDGNELITRRDKNNEKLVRENIAAVFGLKENRLIN